MQRSTAFRARFGEDERTVGKVEGCEVVAAAELGSCTCFQLTPVKAAGNHEVKDEEELFAGVVRVEDEDNALAEAAQAADGLAFDGANGWNCGAEKQRAGDA